MSELINENGFDMDMEDDDWGIEITDADIADGDEATEAENNSEATETENADQQTGNGAEQTEETKTQEDKTETDQFVLKHLGEEKSVSRDEVITLAQKGMDYDRIHGKYDDVVAENATLKEQMADYENTKEQLNFFGEIAKQNGITLDDLIVQTLAAQAAAKNGTSIDAELPAAKLNLERKAFEIEKSKWEKDNTAAQSAESAEEKRQAEIRADLARFAEEFPDAAKDIEHKVPQEVWDAVQAGNTTLTAEYRKYANKQKDAEIENLKSQIEQNKQNEKNKQRSTGSQSTGSVAPTGDAWDIAWANDD